ncbi:TIGR03769 domain-containing protein [Corynebacterium hindlerae]|uniref:TIGR03769 domain-containing protein n=1 Tax=Corynebacterium hindlerae TaxID=699041 RepID=A0A7G5FDR8_9CORY|nr:choice-of-anchor M domain-containing protein [Corynebacterium hindlerae]QMV84759.1 TIGR03769 domain-containing protein [Corynebacterium hindlerae]
MKKLQRVVGVLLAGSLCLNPHIAVAGPNDDKSIATEEHVDSPKIFWEGDSFLLKSESSQGLKPIEETANWIGKGDTSKKQQYVWQVGDDPRLEFLGDEGDLLYWAPAAVDKGYPIWIGFGADIGIPVEQFRDESFQLDLIDFDGPGKMELFTASTEDFPVTRLLSSHDQGRRSSWINPGMHTHNETTFTRPGQYTATYRASARDLEGKLVASKPQTVAWQVGGTRPSSDGLGNIRTAYDKATEGDTSKYSFTIQPHDSSSGGKDAQYLTDLTFSTGSSSDSGTAVFYIDGYYLAEVPVKNGTATWPEMIGSQRSNFQVVYIPAGKGARWVSEPLEYERTAEGLTTQQAGNFPEPASQDPAPAFDYSDKELTDNSVTISTEPYERGEDMVAITVQPADDRISFRVRGGYYESEDAEYPDCEVNFISAPGERTQVETREGCTSPGMVLRLELTPDATTIAQRSNFSMVVPESGEVSGETKWAKSQGAESDPDPVTSAPATPTSAVPEPKETASPTAAPASPTAAPAEPAVPGKNEPTKTAEPQPDPKKPAQKCEKLRIDDGHVDLGPVMLNDKLTFALGDDSGIHFKGHATHDVSNVALVVKPHARQEIGKKGITVEKFPFLKGTGDHVWALSQSQKQGLIWPGFSSEHVPGLEKGTQVTFEIQPLEAPKDGQWWAFLTDNFGTKVQEMLASSDGPASFKRDGRVHMHNYWMFTKPGIYRMKMRTLIGSDQATEWNTVTFHVLDKGQTEIADDECAPESNPSVPGAPSLPGAPGGKDTSKGNSDLLTAGLVTAGVVAAAKVVKDLKNAAAPQKEGGSSQSAVAQGGTKSQASHTGAQQTAGTNAAPAQPGKKMLASTGANVMILIGLAMWLAGMGFAFLSLRRLRG